MENLVQQFPSPCRSASSNVLLNSQKLNRGEESRADIARMPEEKPAANRQIRFPSRKTFRNVKDRAAPKPNYIHNLPNELLQEIFSFNAHHTNFVYNPVATIKVITQVCRRWRACVRAFPFLMAKALNFEDPLDNITSMLQMSKPHPIDFVLPSLENKIGTTSSLRIIDPPISLLDAITRVRRPCQNELKILGDAELLQQCLARSKTVTLHLHQHEMRHAWDLVQNFLPQLDSIAISIEDNTALSGPWRFHCDTLFLENVEWKLRCLHLFGCAASLSAPAFSLLEELVVAHLEEQSAVQPHQLLAALRNIPNLKRLSLIDTTRTMDWQFHMFNEVLEFRAEDEVRLEQLESLILAGPLHHCAFVLKALKVPVTCRKKVKFAYFLDPTFHYAQFMEELAETLEGEAGDRLMKHWGDSMSIQAFERDLILRIGDVGDSPLVFSLSHHHTGLPTPWIHQYILGLIKALAKFCPRVTHLHLQLHIPRDPGFDLTTARIFFEHFPSIQTLHIEDDDTLQFFQYYITGLELLVYPFCWGSPIPQPTAVMESLEWIHFHGIDFSNGFFGGAVLGFISCQQCLYFPSLKELVFEHCIDYDDAFLAPFVELGITLTIVDERRWS